MCFIIWTPGKSSALRGTYFILVESMPGKYRKSFVFNFKYSSWMITVCHTVFCMLPICAVEQMVWDIIWYMPHILYHIYVFREGSSFRSPQLGLRYLSDSNSWNVNENLKTVKQMLKITEQACFRQCSCTA